MACGAGKDWSVAAVAPLQPAHGLALLPPRTRLLPLQRVQRRTTPVNIHQLEAGGARALNDSPLLNNALIQHSSAYRF